ncbi:MAG: PAS domain S-box protein [Gammaproteobacteria bacterium]|nr:PAS domain S-box protein [Gammaproteobacteria bacterium]MCW8924001.1 PAS domain S-box protein [Gammaproteobacteria bacterium]
MSVVFPIMLGFTLVKLYPDWHWSHYPLHSMVESAGVLSALIIASLMVIMLRKRHLPRHYIMVVCALIGMGLLDGFHAALYVGESFVWLHSIATMLGGILFAAVWVPESWLSDSRQNLLLYSVLAVSLSIGTCSIILPDMLPVMIIDGRFSQLARIINITGGAGFLIGTSYFIRNYIQASKAQSVETTGTENMVFANHCLLFGVAGLLFEVSVLWDAGWWWWHILRLMAYFVVLVYLISLFKRVQDQLGDAEGKLRLINSRVPGILYQFRVDVNGKRSLPYVSSMVESYLGLSDETIMDDAEKLFALVHPDDLSGFEVLIAKSMENMTHWEWEGRFITPTGDLCWLRGTSMPRAMNDGSILWDGVFVDVTERKKSEIALSNEKNKVQNYLDIVGVILVALNENGEVALINRKGCEILGYPEDEVIGKNWFNEFIPERFRSEVKDVFAQLIKGELESFENYEYLVLTRSGDEKLISWNNIIFCEIEGRKCGTLSSGEDITQRKATELELEEYRGDLERLVVERTEELEQTHEELIRKERLATLGQLTATVSHELRNPLGAMKPSLYIIEKKSDKNDERLQQAVACVDRSINRCDRIIDELLDFTRITDLERNIVRINEWLESVIDEQVINKGIRLEKDLFLKDVELLVDSNRLQRAVINVVENACHAMMDDCQVVNNNACLHIKTQVNDERVDIIISDNGSGIAEDVLEKIFEPLFSTKGFGVGLGMPTVKQIMEQHGGGIVVNSEQGKGTTITLWLPMR